MKNWKALLIIVACFGVVAVVDRPEHHCSEMMDHAPVKYEKTVIKERVLLVDNLVDNPAKPVYSPSPIVWR